MRREFPQHVRKAVWQRCEGRCEKCGTPFSASNPVEYDHITECALDGDNTIENCQALGVKCCHKPKTAADASKRAKADRCARAAAGLKRVSRPMPGSKASGWRKKMNGEVERR